MNAFGASLDLEYKNLYTNFEYIYKNEDARLNNVTPNVVSFSEKVLFDGNAITWNLGYSQKGFGIGYTFRRLENMRFFSERSFLNLNNNPTTQLSMNYLPALTKQHDYTLANIYIYQAQPGLVIENYGTPLVKSGEIGNSVDLFYNIKKGTLLGGKYGTKLSVNWAYWANLTTSYSDPSGIFYFTSDDLTYKSEFLNFDDKIYSEINAEIRKKWSPKLKSISSIMGGSFTSGSTRIGINYGRQRGGLLCVGGVCRPVSKNTGVTLNLVTTF